MDQQSVGHGTPTLRDADREVGPGEKATVAARRYVHEMVQSINNHYNTIEILIKREQQGWSSMLVLLLIFNWWEM